MMAEGRCTDTNCTAGHGYLSSACPRRARWLVAAVVAINLLLGIYFSSNYNSSHFLAWYSWPHVSFVATYVNPLNVSLQSDASAITGQPTLKASVGSSANSTNSTNPEWVPGQFPPNYPNVKPEEVKNPHNFTFINVPSGLCENNDIELLVCSPSKVSDYLVRQRLRNSRRAFTSDPTHNTRQLFLIGMPSESDPYKRGEIQRRINVEARTFGDIIQENYIDVYANLTYKTVSLLKWVIQYCPNSKYIVKSDIDVTINLLNLLTALRRQYKPGQDTFVIGRRMIDAEPIRNSKSKWHVPLKLYSKPLYPPFCLGPTYGFTTKAAFKLFEASLKVPFFYLEDVYLTGLCSKEAGVPIVVDPLFEYKH